MICYIKFTYTTMYSFVDQYFKLVKRIIPAGHQGSVVGLEAGGGVCKAIEIQHRTDGFEVLRWHAQSVDPSDEKPVIEKLVSSWDLSSGKRPVIASVCGKGTLIRYIDMPRMPMADLKRAFALEADKYFPFPKETVYTDCCILDPRGGDKRMSVLIAAVKKDLIDARLKLFKDCGVEVLTATMNSVAVSNAFMTFLPDGGPDKSSGAGEQGHASAIVDIGETATNLMIMTSKAPRFNRDIFTGTQEAYKRLGNILGVSPQEARVFILSASDKKDAVSQGVSAFVDSLVSEIRLSFDYFITEKNFQIGRIFVIGEGAALPGVEKILQEHFDIPVVKWNPFEQVALAEDIVKADFLSQGPRLITAFGLALNEYD